MIFYKIVERLKKIYTTKKIKKITKCPKSIICLGSVNLINKNIKFGENVVLYPGVSFEGGGLINIGNNVKIGTNTIIYAGNEGGIEIGDDTIIAGNSYIIDSNHGIEKDKKISSQKLSSAKIIIGRDVWIGANVTVIKGGNIGDGAVIGANSLVNRDIDPYSVAVGTPAKIIKNR